MVSDRHPTTPPLSSTDLYYWHVLPIPRPIYRTRWSTVSSLLQRLGGRFGVALGKVDTQLERLP